MEFNEDQIKATILYDLRRKKVIGGVHVPFDTLKKGFPPHLKGEVDTIAKDLIKKGLLIPKPASYGLQVSINKEKMREIEEFIKKVLGSEF
ncbi:MAG: hypothetical protein PHD81_01690 [Candidatus Nanoarchaeia archaeon]|nr:hypothetical protein [Candidatus Nanoarchaeia archaeon]MDD5587801.1 hypothetical protein [Candidatus Nanoarchaeia archaeon]